MQELEVVLGDLWLLRLLGRDLLEKSRVMLGKRRVLLERFAEGGGQLGVKLAVEGAEVGEGGWSCQGGYKLKHPGMNFREYIF